MSFKDSYKQVITDTINGVDVADKLHDILHAKLQARLLKGIMTNLRWVPPTIKNNKPCLSYLYPKTKSES
jgi:hypothetical protein